MASTLPDSVSTSCSCSLLGVTHRPHRQAREFPYRLQQSTSIYFEDRQFIEGFNLLSNVLAAGSSTRHALGAYVPPPEYLNVAATLVVHPLYTTRAKSDDSLRASNAALRFLRDTNRIVGPVNAKFATAFLFRHPDASRRHVPRRNSGSVTPSTDNGDQEDSLNSAFAKEKSVFSQKDDFWDVVGWAFNCSVRWRRRWDRWKLWLEFLVEILESDWVERVRHFENDKEEKWILESLIAQYLGDTEGRTSKRRLMRAILADGQERSLIEFGEVWRDETRERQAKEEKSLGTAQRINLDEDEWGDYDVDDEDDDDDDDVAMEDGITGQGINEDFEEEFGGSDSIRIRQRLMALLANFASILPQHLTHLEHLFDVYTQILRPLSLPIFSQFLATSPLPAENQSALLINLVLPFLAAAPRRPNIFAMKQECLQNNFFPFSANTSSISDNAKLSLLIEHLLASMWSCERLIGSVTLSASVEEGIKARDARAIGDARKKDKGRNPEQRAAKSVLDMSAERIRLILKMLEDACVSERRVGGALAGADDSTIVSSSQVSDLVNFSSAGEDEDDVGTAPS